LIAQSVEQRIENPRVPGSIPGQGTILYSSKKSKALTYICRGFFLTEIYLCSLLTIFVVVVVVVDVIVPVTIFI
jgi:hypothetical protein